MILIENEDKALKKTIICKSFEISLWNWCVTHETNFSLHIKCGYFVWSFYVCTQKDHVDKFQKRRPQAGTLDLKSFLQFDLDFKSILEVLTKLWL